MQRDIKLLGALSIVDNGETAVLQASAKGCALLTYLIVRGQTESRERIADLLWEANSTAEGLRNLRVLLTRLRAFLPDVLVTRKALAFAPLVGERIDYLLLKEALAQPEAQTLLKSLQLYRGNLLAGFYLEDAPRFQEWLTVERERLRRDVLDAHRWLCETWAAEAKWGEGVATAVHWLQVDNLDEEALRWLMQFRAAAGQTAVALTDYEQFHTRLQTQLDLEPEPQTLSLVHELRNAYGQAARELFAGVDFTAQVSWPTRTELAAVGHLPSAALMPFRRNPNFMGRQQVLLQLADLLLPWPDAAIPSTPPAAILTGMGGVGKTQTAVEFCYRYGRYFPGGVFWVSLAEAQNVTEEIVLLGSERGLGLFRSEEQLTLAEQVGRVQRAWQEPIPRLLIFDNCETEELLAKWLPVTGGCRVLVTSRRGSWSAVWGVTAVPLTVLSVNESRTLLQQLSPHIQADEAAAIAAEVGHLPLALHLISSFLNRYRQITAANYLAQLQDTNLLYHPSLQGRGSSPSPTGHELNVARTYALSFAQLDQDDPVDVMAQKLLGIVACFAPGEPVGRGLVQAAVVPDEADVEAVLLVEDALNRLVALGFVQAETRETLVMHRLLAAYTSSVLAVAAAVQVVEETMVRLITAVWEKELYLHDLPFAARQLRYVTDRALKRQDALSATLANYLGRHLINRAEYAQAEPYLRQALSIRQRLLGEQVDTAVSMIHLGTLLWKWQSNEAALPYFEEAYQICKNLLGPDHPKTARCLNNLAFLYSRQGNHEKAERFYQETLSIFERTQSMDDVMVPHILVNMALMFQGQGQFAQARDYYERALHLKETVFGIDNYQTAMNQFGLANLMILMGDYQAALPILERSIALRKKLPNGEIILVGPYIRWGELQMIGGQLAEAQTCFEQTLAILNIQPDKPNINWGWLLAKLGQLHRLKGDFAAAETFLQRALLRFAEQPPSYFGNIDVLNQLADLYLQTERLAAAKRVVDDAFAICVQDYGEAHQFTAQVRLRWGEWRQLQGDEEGARVIFEEAEGVLKTAVAPTHIDYIRVQEHL